MCEKVGADVDAVRRGIGSDERIGKRFLFSGIGYGGSCFPKDVSALAKSAQEVNYDFKILDSVIAVNEIQKLTLINKLKKFYSNNLQGKTVALWGLAFKPETDDLRESPAVDLAERLYGKGYDVRIFDSNICLQRLTGANKSFIQATIPHLESLLTRDVAEVIAHSGTLILVHADAECRKILARSRDDQCIIDLGAFSAGEEPRVARYNGICW